MNDEMRTEMVYVKFPEGTEEYEQCSREDAEGTGIIFTAYHPTELTQAFDADGKPTGENKPQEYGLMVITTEVLEAISDVDEYVINQAVKSLKEAGCLVDEDGPAPDTTYCACEHGDD